MIAHVVLFEPKPDLTERDIEDILNGLRAVAREVEGLRRALVGRRIRHGVPGYEQLMRDDYSFACLFEFDTVEGLRSYLAHPAHERVGRHFTESGVRALAYDYHLVDLHEANDLLK